MFRSSRQSRSRWSQRLRGICQNGRSQNGPLTNQRRSPGSFGQRIENYDPLGCASKRRQFTGCMHQKYHKR
jgi:hypothetical protein